MKPIWNSIFKHLVEINEIKDTNSGRTKLKHKIIRCSELYDKYGENLSRFKIPITHIEQISDKEWPDFLNAFNLLYKDIFKDKLPCEHKYKNGKQCDIIGCRKKHK
jgi:hypothetical protein